MNKNILTVVGITILFLGMSITPSVAVDTIEQSSMPTSNGNTLYVGGSGPGNYTKIQDAIDNAVDGDTVFVYNGTYKEHLTVNRSINLIGENKYITVIEEEDYWKHLVNVSADWVNISGFTIFAGYYYNWYGGIFLNSCNNNNITGNIISGDFGIYLVKSNNNTISNNNFTWGYHRLYLSKFSNGNTIKYNNFNEGISSIVLEDHCNDNLIMNNTIQRSDGGIDLHENCINNIIIGNVLSYIGCGGICFFSSNNNIVLYNTLDGYGAGITFDSSNYNTIIGVTISTSEVDGIRLSDSCNNSILCSNIINCRSHGILLKKYSNNNIIHHNNFFNNTENAHDEGDNIWDNGESGNYWDDYNGTDDDGDGIGDTPYNISGGYNQDRYPLMEPWGDNLIPIAKFTWSPVHPDPGETVLFNASQSIDYYGNIILYEWDWDNDGEYDENHTSPTAIHTFDEAGYYPVTLQVTDNDNLTDSKTKTVRVGNHPPDAPIIDGPTGGAVGTELAYTFVITDPDGDDVKLFIDWGDNTSEKIGSSPPYTNVTVKHSWSEKGVYTIIAKAIDVYNAESEWSEPLTVTISNSPYAPEIDGPESGKIGVNYTFTFTSVDPDRDNISYYIDWDDNTTEEWGPFPFNEEITVIHTWYKKGWYVIRCKATDVYGAESESSEYWFLVDSSRISYGSLFHWLFDRFPLLEVFLRAMNLLR